MLEEWSIDTEGWSIDAGGVVDRRWRSGRSMLEERSIDTGAVVDRNRSDPDCNRAVVAALARTPAPTCTHLLLRLQEPAKSEAVFASLSDALTRTMRFRHRRTPWQSIADLWQKAGLNRFRRWSNRVAITLSSPSSMPPR